MAKKPARKPPAKPAAKSPAKPGAKSPPKPTSKPAAKAPAKAGKVAPRSSGTGAGKPSGAASPKKTAAKTPASAKRPAKPSGRGPKAPSAPTSTIAPVLRAAEHSAAAPSGASGVYGVHPGVEMMIKWAADLPAKTGRTLDQWVALVKKEGPSDPNKRIDWLRSRHRLGTNSAWWIAERAEGKGGEDLDPDLYLRAAAEYVEEQYAGKKVALRPLYESLLRACLSLGKDAKACPCKTIVPIYRKHVIAQIKPTTSSRIDLGLALGDTKAAAPLIDTGGFAKKDRITHRVEIAAEADITPEVRAWLRSAYERDA